MGGIEVKVNSYSGQKDLRSGRKISPNKAAEIRELVPPAAKNGSLARLPVRQGKTLDAFLNVDDNNLPKLSQIAREQKVSRALISESLRKGICNLKRLEKGEPVSTGGRPPRKLDVKKLRNLVERGFDDMEVLERVLRADRRIIYRIAEEEKIILKPKSGRLKNGN